MTVNFARITRTLRCFRNDVLLIFAASVAIVALAGPMAAAARAQTSITLKTSVTRENCNSALTLAEVAEIAGDDAQALRDLVVTQTPEKTRSPSTGTLDIHVEQVRDALSQANVNWGRVNLRGSTCSIHCGQPAQAPAVPRLANGHQHEVFAASSAGQGTFRALLATRICAFYAVSPDDLRLNFDDDDSAFLDSATGTQRIDIEIGATTSSARLPIHVWIHEGDRISKSQTVSVKVLVSKVVLLARAPIQRGEAIGSDQVVVNRQWVSPSARASLGIDQAVGTIAARSIGAGSMIVDGDLTTPLACKRGEIVWVHVLSGSLMVRAKARALAQARDGEIVQLKLEGSDRTFQARMSGRGRAVVEVDAQNEQTQAAARPGTSQDP